MQTIYCLSGLGADQRIFQKLNINGCRLVPVPWCAFDKHDDLPCYAQKMAYQIKDEHPVLLGVSFGGMLASEIAKIRPVKKTIIVSSAKDVTELAPMGNFGRFMVHNGLIPVGLAKLAKNQMFTRFGVETDEEKALLLSILKGTDNKFAKWSMKAMNEWRSTTHVEDILHIHGTADKLIVPKFVKPNHWIEGGSHLMVYQRPVEISAIIQEAMDSLM